MITFTGSPYHVTFPIEEDSLVYLSCRTFRGGRKAVIWKLEGRGLDRGYQLSEGGRKKGLLEPLETTFSLEALEREKIN
jgi:hypothetical protein